MSGLAVHNLSAGYNAVPVLHGVSFSLESGEVLAFVGRNGVGKTTLALTLAGLLPASAGEIHLGEVDVTRASPSQRVRLGLGLAAQERAVFQELTVAENFEVAGIAPGAIDRALRLFPDSLDGRQSQIAGTLSGGEQKMLAVARALAGPAQVLILDEPTEGLHPSNVDLLGDHLELARAEGRGVLLIEQFLALAHRLANRFAVMEKGEIVDGGDAADRGLHERIDQRLRI
jgi:branched-chain amino acid transport system ATP-binding protein